MEVHGMPLDVHVDDMPILCCAYLGVLGGASLEHVMGSDNEGRFLVPVDRSMPLYHRHYRLEIVVFDVEEVY